MTAKLKVPVSWFFDVVEVNERKWQRGLRLVRDCRACTQKAEGQPDKHDQREEAIHESALDELAPSLPELRVIAMTIIIGS
jgi:hypothetical protein